MKLKSDASPISESELKDLYQELLDSIYGDVKVAGYEYPTGQVLFDVDPVAFRVGLCDWIDAQVTDGAFVEVEGQIYRADDIDEESQVPWCGACGAETSADCDCGPIPEND